MDEGEASDGPVDKLAVAEMGVELGRLTLAGWPSPGLSCRRRAPTRRPARPSGTVVATLKAMRVIVDFEQCESNALCMAAAPEVFELRDDDLLYVLQDEPPEELRAKVVAAVRSCPKGALSLAD